MELREKVAQIIQDPEIKGGQPVIAGTRIGVHTIVGYARLYHGDIDRILAEFPDLTRSGIGAALEWYHASEGNRAEIDSILREQHAFYEAGLARQRANGGQD